MGLPSWLGGTKKNSGDPSQLPSFKDVLTGKAKPVAGGLAPPPSQPINTLATSAGFMAANAARRARKVAGSGDGAATPKPAPAIAPTPRKLFDAGRAAMGLY